VLEVSWLFFTLWLSGNHEVTAINAGDNQYLARISVAQHYLLRINSVYPVLLAHLLRLSRFRTHYMYYVITCGGSMNRASLFLMASASGLQPMANERRSGYDKQPKIVGPKAKIEAWVSEAVKEEIRKAAVLTGSSEAQFFTLSAHEYAKTVIAIHEAQDDLDARELKHAAFSALKNHREAFSPKRKHPPATK
jgi:uncharacterized protein (DUF1778 family)